MTISRRWLANCVVCRDNTFPQLLLLIENADLAADRIYKAVVASAPGEKRLLPIPKPYDAIGTTLEREMTARGIPFSREVPLPTLSQREKVYEVA